MKTIALIEKGKDGAFGVFTPDIESTIFGEGPTVAEAKADFVNSVNEVVASYEGMKLPEELNEIEFEYRYDIASIFDYYNWINITKFADVAGINASLLRQYKKGLAYVSEAQVKKIEKALHKAGNELRTARLV